MLSFFRKEFPGVGSVLYRGNLAPRAEEYSFLERQGFHIRPHQDAGNAHWALDLRHPELGEARMFALRDFEPPPRAWLDYVANLTEQEKADAAAAGTGVTVEVPATRKNILADRKRFLGFLRAIMADDAVVAIDHTSGQFWSRAALDDETSHDADVDIMAIYGVHAVTEDGGGDVQWLHTHGLAEIGAVDFDIIRPHESLMTISGTDAIRALAFAVAEGLLTLDGEPFDLLRPDGSIRLVPAAEFDRAAPADQRAARTPDEDHVKQRGVVCEPKGGFLGLGRSVRASRRLSSELDDNTLINFTKAATELMADRARATLPVLRRLMGEFAELGLPAIAKIGYPTDSDRDAHEHLWFTIHEVGASDIDATLESSPFDIAAMKAGQRGRHPIERLTDWAIMTPAGPINPRYMVAARLIRENFDAIREIIRAADEE